MLCSSGAACPVLSMGPILGLMLDALCHPSYAFMLYALYFHAFCNALLLCSSSAACPVLSVKPALALGPQLGDGALRAPNKEPTSITDQDRRSKDRKKVCGLSGLLRWVFVFTKFTF